MAYTVSRRTPEIGLRMAAHTQVRLQILREGMMLAAAGLVLGLAGAYALGRAMQSILQGTEAVSFPVLLSLPVMYLRRASSVDPMVALRQE